MLTLGVVFEALTGSGAGTYDALPLSRRVITDAVIDSRLTIPGCLFVALPGEKVDGHAFVADAFGRGAAVALVDKEVPGFDSRRPAGREARSGGASLRRPEAAPAPVPAHRGFAQGAADDRRRLARAPAATCG